MTLASTEDVRDERYLVPGLARGLQILGCFSRQDRELTGADLVAKPIPKSRRRLKKRRRTENFPMPRALRGTSGARVSTTLPSCYIRHDQTN